jgi:PAS domain S-box-containing protein
MVIAQLYTRSQLESQITRLQRLNQEIRLLTAISSNHGFFTEVCISAQRIFDATHVVFGAYDTNTQEYIITNTTPNSSDLHSIHISQSSVSHSPQRIIDIESLSATLSERITQNHQTGVVVSVPLQHNNTLIGVLLIINQRHEFLTNQDMPHATQFAKFAASHYNQLQLTTALNESERRYRFLINESSNPIIVINAHDIVIHMNHAARRLIGVDSIDIMTFSSFFAPSEQLALQEKRHMLEFGEHNKLIWQSEIVNKLWQHVVPIEIEAQIIKHERNPHEILISLRDIRQQREIERRQTLREQDLAMFQHITSMVNGSLDLNVLLERTLDLFDEIQFGQMLGIILINENNEPFLAAHRHISSELMTQIINAPGIIRGAVDMVLNNYDSQFKRDSGIKLSNKS